MYPKMKNIKLVLTGTLPPPIGGVTIFLKYFIDAVAGKSVEVEFFDWGKIFIFKYRDCYLHINSSNEIKRVLYILLGRFFFKKVFFVKHGGKFNENNPLVLMSIKLADGVFCLNDAVQNQLNDLGVRNLKHTTIFSENIKSIRDDTQDVGAKFRECKKFKILLYCNNDKEINGKSIYGLDFIYECMDALKDNYEIIIIDLSEKYRSTFKEFKNVVYYSKPVDFLSILKNVDVYVRPTRTDGMSVALLEAGVNGVKCLASDAVERPDFVEIYKLDDVESFIVSLEKILSSDGENKIKLNSVDDVLFFISE